MMPVRQSTRTIATPTDTDRQRGAIRYRTAEDFLDSSSDSIRLGVPVALLITISAIALIPATRRVFRPICRALARTARYPRLSLAILTIFAAMLFAIPWMFGKVQPANVHDEFSYLLAADTLRHGRLTNPTPPFWESFQTMHVLVTPTYMSKFPPAQGLMLAAGWVMGSPRVGAIASGALACAAVAWMLRSRMSWRWSLVGGLLAALVPATYEWTQSFWGGSVAMLGGALFCGAMLRADRLLIVGKFARREALKIGAIAGIGLAILANSRPFEGMLFAIILGTILLTRIIRRHRFSLGGLAPFFAGAMIMLAPVGAWMGYYNYRITGSPLRMPYELHAEQYMTAPVFWWQGTHQPQTDIPHIRAFHEQFEFREYNEQLSLGGFFANAYRKVSFILRMWLHPLIGIVVLVGGAFALWRWRTARFALLVPLILLIVHMLCTPWLRAHYLAPVMPLWIMFVVYSIRGIGKIPIRSRSLRFSALGVAVGLLIASAAFSIHNNILVAGLELSGNNARQTVLDAVNNVPGQHVVLVYYADGPQNPYEWVYNPADIPNAPVIFAHVRTPEQNTGLANHYSEHSFWLLTIMNERFQLKSLRLMHEPQSQTPPPTNH
ncbi:MAG: hypothetical protein H7Z14_15115 [Anaerolineae bacterium]|nr:hypothetical protein [Phycisphaerae bacterium]